MGNAVSVTRLWSIHTKTPPVGRRQPMTSLPARPQYKGAPGKYVILFFVFNDCFVWSVHSTGKNDFFTVTMASTSKAFRRCVHPCPRYLTPDDTHDLCVFCLGEEHARDVLEGAICERSACTVSFSRWESSALVCLSFRGRRGSRLLPAVQDPLLPRHGGECSRGARRWSWPMS